MRNVFQNLCIYSPRILRIYNVWHNYLLEDVWGLTCNCNVNEFNVFSQFFDSSASYLGYGKQARKFTKLKTNIYKLLTKCKVKMDGYWPTYFCPLAQ